MTALPCTAIAQDSLVNWRGARQMLERDYADDVQELANWCRGNGLADQVDATFALYRPRDMRRLYIFPADEKPTAPIPDGPLAAWQTQVNELNRTHAQRIFDLARRAAEAKAGGSAYQLLHEVLHYDPDHAEVRRALGHRTTDDGWRVASEKVSVRKAKQAQEHLGWPGGSYLTVRTPYFEIDSKASEERTIELAKKLERWHSIWRQVFFDYWSNDHVAKKLFNGQYSMKVPRKRKKFRVLFFEDQAQYARELSKFVPGAAASTGYYGSNQRLSFFPDGDDRTEDTWRHELTHQLFRETVNTKGEPFEDRLIWLDEGIAAWFESLADFGDYVTLGGFDSRRIQYARIRVLREGFYIPLAELTSLGRVGLQRHPDMVRIYSQAAGVSDMLMNDNAGAMAEGTIELLRLIYARKLKQGTFEELIGKSWAELDERYPKFLSVNAKEVAQHLTQPATRTELSVPNAQLDSAAFEAIGRCQNLTWLDLSRNLVRKNHVGPLLNCEKLTQLILVGSLLEPASFEALQGLPNLQEIELGNSNVDDSHLGAIAKLPNINRLGFAATAITDTGLMKLATMAQLRQLDVSRTGVTANGVQSFQQLRPDVQIEQ